MKLVSNATARSCTTAKQLLCNYCMYKSYLNALAISVTQRIEFATLRAVVRSLWNSLSPLTNSSRHGGHAKAMGAGIGSRKLSPEMGFAQHKYHRRHWSTHLLSQREQWHYTCNWDKQIIKVPRSSILDMLFGRKFRLNEVIGITVFTEIQIK